MKAVGKTLKNKISLSDSIPLYVSYVPSADTFSSVTHSGHLLQPKDLDFSSDASSL